MINDWEVGRRGNRLLAALPQETLALLGRDSQQVSLSHGTMCFGAGERIDQVYFPLNGMISLTVTAKDGEMIETACVGREGAAGLQSGLGERNSYSLATIQVPGEFVTMPASQFEHAARDSAATRELIFRYIEIRWTESQQIAACNAVHNASARLCRCLLQAADCIGSDRVPLTQEYIAEMLGVQRTTVTLLAQELLRGGVIRYSRGRITIIDRTKLEASSCECYDAIKHEHLSLKLGIKMPSQVIQDNRNADVLLSPARR